MRHFDIDTDREMLRAAAAEDTELRRWLQQRRLIELGSGGSANAFAIGDHVVRVSTPDDCPFIYKVMAKQRTKAGLEGWPWIEYVAEYNYDDNDYCVAIVDRVRIDTDIPAAKWSMLRDAVDQYALVQFLADRGPSFDDFLLPALPTRRFKPDPLSPTSIRWGKQLLAGLRFGRRCRPKWQYSDGVDNGVTNYGLTRGGDAVWVDFNILDYSSST